LNEEADRIEAGLLVLAGAVVPPMTSAIEPTRGLGCFGGR